MKKDIKLTSVKDGDFESLGKKSLKTAMKSTKLDPIRSWEDALAEYLSKI